MKFTVVICPGAWPLLSFMEPLMEAFENRSHPAITSIVDTYPTTDPNVTVKVNPDSEYLRTKVLEPVLETGADVVVFMHSYGGTYGASSLEGLSKEERQSKGLKGGIIATVQTAAFIAPTGATALDCMGVDRNNLPYWIEYDAETDMVGINKEYAKQVLFNDLPEDEAERLASLLPKQPMVCFTTPAHWDPYNDPYYRGKLGYIYTGADLIFPYEAQQMQVASAGIGHTYLLEGSSHSPHLEQPGHLADLVIDMVRNITGKC
ncbi:hypothetical protein V2G26_010661 [Clonostachys chloroleuca]